VGREPRERRWPVKRFAIWFIAVAVGDAMVRRGLSFPLAFITTYVLGALLSELHERWFEKREVDDGI
jgi:hypothetical protein